MTNDQGQDVTSQQEVGVVTVTATGEGEEQQSKCIPSGIVTY
jgi:hypothetical protein